jgi:hypothetical protein
VGSSSCHPRTGSWEIEPVDARETFLWIVAATKA